MEGEKVKGSNGRNATSCLIAIYKYPYWRTVNWLFNPPLHNPAYLPDEKFTKRTITCWEIGKFV